MERVRRNLAEMIGTWAIVFLGTGSAVIAKEYIGFFGVAFVFGFTVTAMVASLGSISGGHFNPAISLAALLDRRISLIEFVNYLISQIVGAILASFTLLQIVSGKIVYLENKIDIVKNVGLGQNGFGKQFIEGYNYRSAFITEMVLTAILCLVVLIATSKINKIHTAVSSVAIGFTVLVAHMLSIPVTGTSINPARSIGPALIVRGQALKDLPLFIIAPLVGAVLSVIIWRILFNSGNSITFKKVKKEIVVDEESDKQQVTPEK